jgi:pimeloyl-ACP methyl ester carboxylesterase
MKSVYLFSGLGADERVFQYLDLSFCKPIFIKWNLPNNNESIESYATRLLEQIQDKNPVLVGVSFGGIMAVEVAKLITTEKVILISSVKTKQEIPFYFRYAGNIKMHKLLPVSLLQYFNFISNSFFGVEDETEKKLLKNIIKDTNLIFLKWAIDKIVHWQNEYIPNNIKHIHGDSDKIFPIKFIKSDITIENGSHFMIVNKSTQIYKLLYVIIV